MADRKPSSLFPADSPVRAVLNEAERKARAALSVPTEYNYLDPADMYIIGLAAIIAEMREENARVKVSEMPNLVTPPEAIEVVTITGGEKAGGDPLPDARVATCGRIVIPREPV